MKNQHNFVVTSCLFCNNNLDYSKRNNKFCNKSCAASYNNTKFPKRKSNKKLEKCKFCGNLCNRSEQIYCSNRCQQDFQRTNLIKKYKSGEKKHFSVGFLKKYLFETREHKCQICNGVEWFGNPMPLSMDHVDGNASNNSEENLRLICPNCDRFLPTFGYRNKGNGRQSRGIKRYDKYDK